MLSTGIYWTSIMCNGLRYKLLVIDNWIFLSRILGEFWGVLKYETNWKLITTFGNRIPWFRKLKADLLGDIISGLSRSQYPIEQPAVLGRPSMGESASKLSPAWWVSLWPLQQLLSTLTPQQGASPSANDSRGKPPGKPPIFLENWHPGSDIHHFCHFLFTKSNILLRPVQFSGQGN